LIVCRSLGDEVNSQRYKQLAGKESG